MVDPAVVVKYNYELGAYDFVQDLKIAWIKQQEMLTDGDA